MSKLGKNSNGTLLGVAKPVKQNIFTQCNGDEKWFLISSLPDPRERGIFHSMNHGTITSAIRKYLDD